MALDESLSTATATASALHRFNRYEIKYYLPESTIPEFRERVQARMGVDANKNDKSRRITSLYYDSSDLRCYWEKIEGLRFRRKLRIRAYGEPENINDDTIVFVEIKQRVNRVTQKRRIPLSYREAKILCDERKDPENPAVQQAFINEVLVFSETANLQPTVITTYHREAFVGIDADLGLRITMDHRVQGRGNDFNLGTSAANKFIIPQHISIVEVKANERVPTWFTDLAAELSLDVIRVSKYCKAIEAESIKGEIAEKAAS
ncbi:MAG: vacuolar transporter [SAR86 cluster bacterium]|uniref:Vacuolar transporter n=1 Tax=SAR86 cluster bacterium TaxID=2030880 RepID=A0A2A5CD50_9GAMM|nr:MAG: vacuolar transporter [SAR86 cluster bacterium]